MNVQTLDEATEKGMDLG